MKQQQFVMQQNVEFYFNEKKEEIIERIVTDFYQEFSWELMTFEFDCLKGMENLSLGFGLKSSIVTQGESFCGPQKDWK